MKTGKITQWEYARVLLPYDETMTEERLIKMPRGALFCWIEETKKKRDEARKEENAELAQEYQELIEEQKNDLLSVAMNMTTLEKKGLSEWKGPCPICKTGHDRFHVNTRGVPWWYCRKCGDGGDTVALVAKVNGLTMWEAAEELAGYSPRERKEIVCTRTYTKITPSAEPEQPLTDFTTKFEKSVQLFKENRLRALAYFEYKRGLTCQTVLENRVGLAQTQRGLAIAYPCERLNEDGSWQITAYNRRYLDNQSPKTKLIKGGKWGLYRLRRIRNALCLLVVEGEENALSVWERVRANNWRCDVVSVGSQGNFKSLKKEICALTSNYQHLIIWADDQNIATEALDLYHHNSALAICSPQLANEDKPLDANDLLKRGDLDEILDKHLRRLSVALVCKDALWTPEMGGQSVPPAPVSGGPASCANAPTNDHQPQKETNGRTYAPASEGYSDEPVSTPKRVVISEWWASYAPKPRSKRTQK